MTQITQNARMKDIMIGMDLHSNNVMIGLMDLEGHRLRHKRVACDLQAVDQVLAPYRERIDTIAVESTYNWYWLVDGLREKDYNVVLANPAKMDQYEALKHTDDQSDAYHLAELLRLKILPTGHIYDPEVRPVRDALRRRMRLVQQRTSLLLSLTGLQARTLGRALPLKKLKTLTPALASHLFEQPANQLIAQIQVELVKHLNKGIARIEAAVLKKARPLPCYAKLLTIPGIGKILGLTITLETGEVKRFPSAGDYASYCRCVDTHRISNGKSKGQNNGKSGNRYLAWAYVEASHFARRSEPACQSFWDRKAAQTNRIVATKALACKLSKAAWHVMTEDVAFDLGRVFPGRPSNIQIATNK